MPENEGSAPATGTWLSGAYIPPDDVPTGPIPTITDDMTAEDVTRLSQVEALMSSAAPPLTDPVSADEPHAAPEQGRPDDMPETVDRPDADAEPAGDPVRQSGSEAESLTALDGEPAEDAEAVVAEVESATGADADGNADAEVPAEPAEALAGDAEPAEIPVGDAELAESSVGDAEPAEIPVGDAELAESSAGDAQPVEDLAGDAEPAEVPAGHAEPAVTPVRDIELAGSSAGHAEPAEDAETTSFAAVDPRAEPSIARERTALPAGDVAAHAVTPPSSRRGSRAVPIAVAGALIVVILGIVAAAAFGGERRKNPHPSPVPSAGAPAATTPAPLTNTGPDKAFPRFLGTKSPVRGRITDRTTGVSYSRLGGVWAYGRDDRKLFAALGLNRSDPQLKLIMTAGGAEYLSAPLPASIGRSATATAAQAVARSVLRVGSPGEPTLLPYAVEPLGGGLKGWLAGFKVQDGPTAGEIVAAAVLDTGAGRPGVLCMTVPKADKAVRPDIRAVIKSLRVAP